MRKNKRIKLICILTPIIIFIAFSCFSIYKVPDTVFLHSNQNINLKYVNSLFTCNDSIAVDTIGNKSQQKEKLQLKLLGLLPVKNVNVQRIPDMQVYPGGNSVGVKLNTKGVLAVALNDIDGDNGKITSPSAKAGIEIGDNILSIDGKKVSGAETLAKYINDSKGKKIKVELLRKGQILYKSLLPEYVKYDEKYKIGLWVRDSSAGVGTLTFYDPQSGIFGALGHPVTDVDTGTNLNIENGELVNSSIVKIKKGVKGTPGELKGIFVNEENILGNVKKNTECGIFGEASKEIVSNCNTKKMKIGLRDEIKIGKAYILTTIDSEGPKEYDIEIEKLLSQEKPGPKSMVIRITDKRLLEKTGGIVQGMSGSPIIQNDKIIGAVTHVLINKPDTGYGIYIEWMINDSNILENG